MNSATEAPPLPRGGLAASHRSKVSRFQAGRVRRRSMPSSSLPSTAHGRGWQPASSPAAQTGCPKPKAGQYFPARGRAEASRGGASNPARNSLLKRAMSTPTGHSALQARHSRHRSSTSYTPFVRQSGFAQAARHGQAQRVGAAARGMRFVAAWPCRRGTWCRPASYGRRRRRCTFRPRRPCRRIPSSRTRCADRACDNPRRSAGSR